MKFNDTAQPLAEVNKDLIGIARTSIHTVSEVALNHVRMVVTV